MYTKQLAILFNQFHLNIAEYVRDILMKKNVDILSDIFALMAVGSIYGLPVWCRISAGTTGSGERIVSLGFPAATRIRLAGALFSPLHRIRLDVIYLLFPNNL